MSLSFYFRSKSMSAGKYDDIIRMLEKAGSGEPEGRLYHVCFGDINNLHVLDVWDTKENFDEFSKKLMPVLQKVGVDPGNPEINEIHNIFESKSVKPPQLALNFIPKSMNLNQYKEIIKKLDQAGAGDPEGRIYHISFGSGNNIKVFGVWDSKENFEKFGKSLMLVLKQVGVEAPIPEVYKIHNVIEPKTVGVNR